MNYISNLTSKTSILCYFGNKLIPFSPIIKLQNYVIQEISLKSNSEIEFQTIYLYHITNLLSFEIQELFFTGLWKRRRRKLNYLYLSQPIVSQRSRRDKENFQLVLNTILCVIKGISRDRYAVTTERHQSLWKEFSADSNNLAGLIKKSQQKKNVLKVFLIKYLLWIWTKIWMQKWCGNSILVKFPQKTAYSSDKSQDNLFRSNTSQFR